MKKFTRTGAYALIVENDHIFLTLEPLGPHAGRWDFPGGGIEHGETPTEALHRELREEAALSAERLELLTVLSTHGIHNDTLYHHIGIIYRATHLSPTMTSPEEEGRWFPLTNLPDLTPFVQQYLDGSITQ